MIYLGLGSNVGDRFENFRKAIKLISKVVRIKRKSIIFETEPILPENHPNTPDWKRPFFNMVIECEYDNTPKKLLFEIKSIEEQMGRFSLKKERWAPREIDIDILLFNSVTTDEAILTLPHKELYNRPFFLALLNTFGFNFPEEYLKNYQPLKCHYIGEPEFVGIVNITPDSFSDGGKYDKLSPCLEQIKKLQSIGTKIIELGPQSTRPGATQISYKEEISRLEPILDKVTEAQKYIGIDSFYNETIEYIVNKYSIKWVSNVREEFTQHTVDLLAENNVEVVLMRYGDKDYNWLQQEAQKLVSWGLPHKNLILDPGIGFGLTRYQNLHYIQTISELKNFGFKTLLGHSRKSFMSIFTEATAPYRDIETIAVSDFATTESVDYLRVHNVEDHIRYFISKKMIRA